MKKNLSLILVLFFLVTSCFANQDFSFYAGANSGALNLTLNETLLNNATDEARPSSLLKWQIYASPVIQADAGIKINQRFFINFNGFYALPLSAGKLRDYDWMNLFSTGGTEQTHFSEHSNKLDYYYNAQVSLGIGGQMSQRVQLVHFFSFRYSYLSMTCSNGYRQYGAKIGEQNGSNIYEPWTTGIPKTQLTGKIITFEEQNYFFGIGTQISFKISDSLEAQLLAQVLPAIKSTALDTHHRRSTKYTLFDNSFKLALDASFLLQYKINEQHRLNLKADYCYSFAHDAKIYQSAGGQNWIGATNPGKLGQHDVTLTAGYTYYYEK